MAWQLQGRYFENCSCDMVCPCTTSGFTMPADYDRCRVVLVFHVDSGTVEDVDVSNLTVGVLADTPPVMADGNWRVGVFMDAAASQEQAEKLGAVFAGQLGGPMAMLAPLFGEMLGSRAPRSSMSRTAGAIGCGSATRWRSRWRTSCRRRPPRVRWSSSPACSTRPTRP